MVRSSAIEKNFSAAAETYDSAARFQCVAASGFAEFIREREALRKAPDSVLELGAGSGLLTSHLRQLFPAAEVTVTDLSQSMLNICRRKFAADRQMTFSVADFNSPMSSFAGAYDLVLSSMAMHWSDDFDRSLRTVKNCLKGEKSRFYLCLPLAESTRTLKKLFESESLSFPGLELPRLDSIIPTLCRNGFLLNDYQTAECSEAYDGLLPFLRSFQLTGTGRIAEKGVKIVDLRRMIKKYPMKIENKYNFAFFACEVAGIK